MFERTKQSRTKGVRIMNFYEQPSYPNLITLCPIPHSSLIKLPNAPFRTRFV